MMVITHMVAWGAGLLTGMYFITQLEKGINKNVNQNKKLLKNIKEYETTNRKGKG